MKLKNAYSKIDINKLFQNLQKILATHKAQHIMFDYSEDGLVNAVTFVMDFNGMKIPVKLPARIENVEKVLRKQGFRPEKQQVYRVAWRNVYDWVVAQMALIDTEMVKTEEVFLSERLIILTRKG